MMGGGQLGLLLWKNYVVRKRQPAVLGLIFLWPIVIFVLLYTLRENVDTEDNPTCQFPARHMPRDGLLPFAQSFICSIGNPCESLENYEEVPSYKKARLGPMMMDLQPVLTNKTILTAVDALPKSVRLLRSMAETLTEPEIKKMFIGGIRLSDLFVNTTDLKDSFGQFLPGVREKFVHDLFDTPINLLRLVDPFGSNNVEEIVFASETLEKFLAAVDKEDISRVSRALRSVDPSRIPDIFTNLSNNFDWSKLLEIVNRITATLENYNLIDDVTTTINKILDLDFLKNYIPAFLNVREWLQGVLSLFRDSDLEKIDFGVLQAVIEKLDGNTDWSVARQSLKKLNSLLELIKKIEAKNTYEFPSGKRKNVNQEDSQDSIEVLNQNYVSLRDGVVSIQKYQDLNFDELEIAARVFDDLLNVFSENIVNTLTYFFALLENFVRMTQHIVLIHDSFQEKIFNVSKSHEKIFGRILMEIEPKFYQNVIKVFLRLDVAESFVEFASKEPATEVLCNSNMTRKIFQDESGRLAADQYDLICSDEGKLFIKDLYNVFNFDEFAKIIEESLSTIISMKLSRPISIGKSNFTSSVKILREFLNYFGTERTETLDWNNFSFPEKWTSIFKETRVEIRKVIFGYHLSIWKLIGSRSFSFEAIKMDLRRIDLVVDEILENIRNTEGNWRKQVLQHKPELLETFYLTVNDREKTLKILEFMNFTEFYCGSERKNVELINYPERSDVGLIKGLVCGIFRKIQKLLNMNLGELETLKYQDSFNFTAMNEKIVAIYSLVDDQNDENFKSNFDEFRKNFGMIWLRNIPPSDGLQISVGLLCKFFNLAESPLFVIKSSTWKNFNTLAWSASSIMKNIEQLLDDVLRVNSTNRLSKILENMPESRIFLDAIFHNWQGIIQDVADILSQKIPSNSIALVRNNQEEKTNSLCKYNQSFDDSLEFHAGNEEFVQDKLNCDPSNLIKEWNEQPNIDDSHQIVKEINVRTISAFNWTSGYIDFRRIISKFRFLMNEKISSDLQLTEIPPELKKIITDNESENRSNVLLDFIDEKIDSSISVLRSNVSAEKVWRKITVPRGLNEISVMAKFLSKVLHDGINVVLKLLKSETKSINILTLLGMSQKSTLSIIHKNFHGIFATILYGISSQHFENYVYQHKSSDGGLTCAKLFTWFSNYKVGLTVEEFWSLKNFTCDGDYRDFNVFFDFYVKEIEIWQAPISDYQSHFVRLPKDINDLLKEIKRFRDGTVIIDSLIDENYLMNILNNLKELLETPHIFAEPLITSKTTSWSTYHLFIEALSQILNNAAVVLRNNKLKNNELHLWAMVKPGDINRLVKYFESHPLETLSLFFTLGTLNSTNNSVITMDEVKNSMCNLRFNHSNYWRQAHRKYFLTNLCSYDFYQLLTSATSEEYVELIAGRVKTLKNSKPLTQSFAEFLNAWKKIIDISGNLKFKSNIVNATILLELPNETQEVIHESKEIIIRKFIQELNPIDHEFIYHSRSEIDVAKIRGQLRDHPLTAAWRLAKIGQIWIDIATNEDPWQALRVKTSDNWKLQALLNLIEDTPNLFISTIDTFLNSERLTDFLNKFLTGQLNACDIDKFLIQSKYIKKKKIVSRITDFCRLIVSSDNHFLSAKNMDQYFKPLITVNSLSDEEFFVDKKIEENGGRIKFRVLLNESYFMEPFEGFQSTLIRLFRTYKRPNIPSWWVTFQDNTFNDFKKQFQLRDVRTLIHLVISKSMKIVKEALLSTPELKNSCTFCNTRVIEIINSQLTNHQVYTDLLCRFDQLTTTEIQNIIDQRLYWKKTIGMIKNYEFLNKKEDVDNFTTASQSALHYIADILINYHKNENEKDNLKTCLLHASKSLTKISSNFYINFIIGVVDVLKTNIKILDTPVNHNVLIEYMRTVEKSIPIWLPLSTIAKKTRLYEVKKILPNATINVNLLLDSKKYFYYTKQGKDFINLTTIQNYLNSNEDYKFIKYNTEGKNYNPSVEVVGKILVKSIDFILLKREIVLLRVKASLNLTWLENFLDHLSIILSDSASLLNVTSKINFKDISSVLDDDVLNSIVSLVRNKTIDAIFFSLRDIIDDINLFITNEQVKEDFYALVEVLESMKIFKNLASLDAKYPTSEMFKNWNEFNNFITNDIKLSNETVQTIDQSNINVISIVRKKRALENLKDTFCSIETLETILNFNDSKTTAKEVSNIFCSLDSTEIQNITVLLIKNVNYAFVFKLLLNVNMNSMLRNGELTDNDGKLIFDNIPVFEEIVPFFQKKLSVGLFINLPGSKSSGKGMSNGQFLQDASKLMCGKELLSDNGQFYRLMSSLQDNKKEYDDMELKTLPTDFCRNIYKNVLTMTGGKIIWSYVKPLLRGRILYAPDSPAIKKVMSLANQTFFELENLKNLMSNLEKTLTGLANLSEIDEKLKDFKEVMESEIMKTAMKAMSKGKFSSDFFSYDFSEVAWVLKKATKIFKMLEMLNSLLDCILVDRMVGFETEEALENAARKLTNTNEFLAAVVFVDDDKMTMEESRRVRATEGDNLPVNVTYKIRMDVDFVPSTKQLKNQFWLPGPESSFIENLRYLRGFIQIQDSIDRAIFEVKTGKLNTWKTVSQQMPYPCWKFAPFQSILYESQGLILCFFFAMMLCVGAAVRNAVWERESQNSMVMSVMGLKPWRNTFAWFITSTLELTIVALSICLILIFGKILPNSNPVLLMVLLMDYVFSIVTFCYMISTFFSSASLAAITTVVMFLLTYIPYIIVISMQATWHGTLALGYNLLLCLSMSTSFCYGLLYAARREVQGTGLTWKTVWDRTSSHDQMSLGIVLLMIALDGCIYAVIGYLVDRYTNSGRGFEELRSRSLWWANNGVLRGHQNYLAFVNSLYFTNDVLHISSTYQDEESDTSSIIVNEKHVGVRFEGIKKVFHGERGEIIAVNDFTLKLRDGEVTSLLGRNGAGKTTIIKMLTGMLTPTSGEIYLNGENKTKPNIGVCPQNNVLIETLTPREHMNFYAVLKGSMNNDEIDKNVNSMMMSLELGRQEHEPVSRLSGGTKRRLCVALAFLGYPNLVILDEPGAGVDPAARRRIWRLIDQHRSNRTILLSTHHLDEADMLSDTVVVMHRGNILCTGSPLTLKKTYGQGYWINLAFSFDNKFDKNLLKQSQNNVLSIVDRIADNVDAKITNDTSEITVNVPFNGNNGQANDIAGVLEVLEENKKSLNYSRISLECETLEQVFLNLCSKADNERQLSEENSTSVFSTGFNDPEPDDTPLRPTRWRQFKALLKKRYWHFSRDWKAPVATLILPTLFVAVAMGFSLVRPPSGDEPALELNPNIYGQHSTKFFSIDNHSDVFFQHVLRKFYDEFGNGDVGRIDANDTRSCDCIDGNQACKIIGKSIDGLVETSPGRPTLDWITTTLHDYIEKRYGGWSFSHLKNDPLFIVWFNNKGYHSMPSFLNSLNDGILGASGDFGHLKIFNHPLKLSSDQLNRTSLLQHVADVGIALVLLTAFSLVAAQGSKELVRERVTEEKRILYLAGVHPVTYWTSTLVWDFFIFLCSISCAIIVFEIFGLPAYVARDNLPGIFIILFLFAWGSLPFTHLFEKICHDSSISSMILFCVNTFIGVFCLATILIIDILGKSDTAKDARELLHNIMLLFPQYALADALIKLSTNDIAAELLQRFNMDTYKSPLGWDLLGPNYAYMFTVGIVYYLINLSIECRFISPYWPWKKSSFEREIFNDDEDDDVKAERIRVEKNNNSSLDLIKTIMLRKVYSSVYGKNVALRNLSFGVEAGSCFGLLGVNGAGKSTTFKMLTTELRATSGKIMLNDRVVGGRPLCNGEIGYCPQADALDGFLTPYQCLTIHGEVCGIDDVPACVELMLQRFDLNKYRHQRVSSLSGGNKRKLCAAVSVMAPVTVVLMDEPTSGMDPASKELVACAVRKIIKTKTCVIMTSHSVAECEKLCTRIGILAKAGLRCIGTVQHLKHKFGEGYVAFLRFSQAVEMQKLKNLMSHYFSMAKISSRQATAVRFLIPKNDEITLSETFRRLRNLAVDLDADDYSLTQSSLDQVLVNFSEELEDDSSVSECSLKGRVNLANSCSSMDAIHMDTF